MTTETPSGKNADQENFPVGSFLIAAHLRPHVAAFYDFARAADDISDSPDLGPLEKITRLDAFERVLIGEAPDAPGFEKAISLRNSLAQCGVTPDHARALLSAFRQDAIKKRYQDWRELHEYCQRSADPVGRFLLDLHGESGGLYPFSDALCSALQVLNHLQDCGDDLRALDRCYVPRDWMEEAGGDLSELLLPQSGAAFAQTKEKMIAKIRGWLVLSRQLPRGLRNARLAMESAVIVALAHRLTDLLSKQDPLARRVALSKVDFFVAGIQGVLIGYFGRQRAA